MKASLDKQEEAKAINPSDNAKLTQAAESQNKKLND